MTSLPTKDELLSRVGRAIRAFVESPTTNLVKGIVLLLIGLSEASRTLREDLQTMQLRAGHGLVLIGLFNVLDTLPHFIEGIEASIRYVDARKRPKDRPPEGPGHDHCEPTEGSTDAR
jgi:hypothetical protein